MKNRVRDALIISGGEVVKFDEHNYSSTEVYTSGTNRNPTVSSVVRHHQQQKVWYVESNGAESNSQFYNCNISAREGHQIANLTGRKTNKIHRFVNLTTGYYWRIKGKKPPQTVVAKIFASIWHKIIALILAAIIAIPLGGILCVFGIFSYFTRDDFSSLRRMGHVYALLITFGVCLSYSPYLLNVAPNFAPPQEVKIDEKWGLEMLKFAAKIFPAQIKNEDIAKIEEKIKKNPEELNMRLYRTKPSDKDPGKLVLDNRKGNGYSYLGSFLLFFILFFYFNWSMKTEMRIQQALDELALDEMN